jgi:hypothetical protein
MFTNQGVYTQTGIQVSDIQAIAAKFDYTSPYTQEQVDLMKQMKVEAGKAGQTIKKFLATIEVGVPTSSAPTSAPEASQPPAINAGLAAQQFHSSIASVTGDLAATTINLYETLDAHLTVHEEAFAAAVMRRVMASPANCMTLVAEELQAIPSHFFRLAPEGATLSTFAIPTKSDNQEVIGPAVDTNASIIQ